MPKNKIKRVAASLDLDENLDFQRRQWRVQRIGWVVMLLIVLAALAGLLGPGPLSGVYAADPTGVIAVQYNRFERHSRQTELRIRASGNVIEQGRVRLWVNADYASELRVLSVNPEPTLVESEQGRLIYHFAASADATDVPITVHYEHQEIGGADGRIGIVNGPEIGINQFVYP